MDPRTPVLVVSGFLGAGKTTLVRHLLEEAQQSGVRVAVVTNEFGELGIDRALLGPDRTGYVELDGGCVCCELGDELIETLDDLRRRVAPDRFIIETSGVALPFDTQLHLWRPPVSDWAGEDMAVVVVDAEQVHTGRDLDGAFADQVSSADLLLLNKIDLVPYDALPAVEARLRALEPEAPIVRTRRGVLDPDVAFAPGPERTAPRRDPGKGPAHGHEAFEALEIAIEPGLDDDEIIERVRAHGALRAKGFVETARGPRLLQGVAARVELVAMPPPAPELIGRIVLVRRR